MPGFSVLEKITYDFEPLNLTDFSNDALELCYKKENDEVVIEKGKSYILIPDKEIIDEPGSAAQFLTLPPDILF